MLAKLCDELLKAITSTKYTINDSLSFTKGIEQDDPNNIIKSFKVNPLFRNVLTKEATALSVKKFSKK